MLEQLNNLAIQIADPIFGWLLHLPRDLVLVLLAVATAGIVTGVRIFTTNQNMMKRCKLDRDRLGELIADAKKRKDKEAVARHRQTLQQIGNVTMKAEGLPLLAAIVPIALLACWAFARISYLPPDPAQPITVKFYTPLAGVGNRAWIVPAAADKASVTAETGWLQKVRDDVTATKEAQGEAATATATPATTSTATTAAPATAAPAAVATSTAAPSAAAATSTAVAASATTTVAASNCPVPGAAGTQPPAEAPAPPANGVAEWQLRFQPRAEPYLLTIRYQDGQEFKEFTKDVIVDGVRYAEPFKPYGPDIAELIEVVAPEYLPGGSLLAPVWAYIKGWLMAVYISPWILGYFLIVLPLSFFLRPLLRVY